MQVRVTEPDSFAPGDTSSDAFGVLSSIGTGIVQAGIWIGVLSPLWILAGVVAFLIYRSNRAKSSRKVANRQATENEQA
jgi:hypothetical protein